MPRRLVRQEPEEPEGEAPEAPGEPEPLLYSAEAAARLLGGISTSMLFRLVHDKELHAVKLGSRSMFTMAELQRFVRAREQAG